MGQRQMGQGGQMSQRQNAVGMMDEMSGSLLSRANYGGYNNNAGGMGPDNGQGDISEINLGQMR